MTALATPPEWPGRGASERRGGDSLKRVRWSGRHQPQRRTLAANGVGLQIDSSPHPAPTKWRSRTRIRQCTYIPYICRAGARSAACTGQQWGASKRANLTPARRPGGGVRRAGGLFIFQRGSRPVVIERSRAVGISLPYLSTYDTDTRRAPGGGETQIHTLLIAVPPQQSEAMPCREVSKNGIRLPFNLAAGLAGCFLVGKKRQKQKKR